uniref:Tra protein n=1 Tax=Streptomyces sp. X335 TaxID=1187849 RepID=I3RM65_9ACTN|nr:FtsK/SpoIIIE domain-containing protein [Streptomyces sp. X335]AFK25583.1 tra protein [Streptomyces sp. X335]
MSQIGTFVEAAPYVTGAAVAARYSVPLVRYYRADPDTRHSIKSARRARRSWKTFCEMAGMTVKQNPGWIAQATNGGKKLEPHILIPPVKTQPDRFGFTVYSRALPGLGLDDWDKNRKYIADQWGVRRIKLWQPQPGYINARAFLREPLEATVPSDLTTIAGQPLVKPGSLRADSDIVLMYSEDGEPITVNLAKSSHGAIQGRTRSGKSITVNTLLAHAALMSDVQTVIIDPNLGAVAPWWRTAHTVNADISPDGPTEILRAIRAEMDRRQGVFWAKRTDKITEFSPELPLILLVIDEVSNFTNWGDKKKAEAFRAELQAVASQGAKFGIRLWLLGQKLEAAVLSTSTRTNLTSRISHQVDTMEDFLHLFPDGRDLEVNAADRAMPQGIGIAAVHGMTTPVRARSVYLPTEHCWTIADAIVDALGEVRPLPAPKLTLAKEAAERSA